MAYRTQICEDCGEHHNDGPEHKCNPIFIKHKRLKMGKRMCPECGGKIEKLTYIQTNLLLDIKDYFEWALDQIGQLNNCKELIDAKITLNQLRFFTENIK